MMMRTIQLLLLSTLVAGCAAEPEPEAESDPYAGLITIDEAETRLQDPAGMPMPDPANEQDEDDVATVSPDDPERR